MNVKPGDLAILLYPKFPQNKGKVCTVLNSIPTPEGNKDGIWWLCEFPTKIMTVAFEKYGLINFATLEDKQLRKITGPDVDIAEVEEIEKELVI